MSSYLQQSLGIHANLIAQLGELEQLRERVKGAKARVAFDISGTRRSRASRQRSRRLHREGQSLPTFDAAESSSSASRMDQCL